MTIKHKKKSRTIYVCPKCRFNILEILLTDFEMVIVQSETIAHIDIVVAR